MVFIFLRTEERLPVWKPANLVKLQGYAMVQKAAKGVDDERKRNALIVAGGTEGPGGEPAPASATVLSSSRFQQAAPPAEPATARKRAVPQATGPKASSVGPRIPRDRRKALMPVASLAARFNFRSISVQISSSWTSWSL